MIAGPCAMVLFGVTGDLAHKKVVPAVYDLANRGLLPPNFSLVGFARRDWDHDAFAQVILDDVKQHSRTPFRQAIWDRLAEGLRFVQGTFDDEAAFARLGETLDKLDAERGTGGNHVFYLAIPPKSFPVVCEQLHKSGLASPNEDSVEPGRHRETLRPRLEECMRAQPAWSTPSSRRSRCSGSTTTWARRRCRTSWRCDSPISSGIRSGTRTTSTTCRSPWPKTSDSAGAGGYYDGIGAARDVIQNHLLQLLALTAMEEPVSFKPSALQAEKIKVLSATKLAEPLDRDTSHGQYAAGWQGGEEVVGLLDEEGFSKDSITETFAAITLEVDTRRWAGVPFYLRTGKRLGRRVTEIALVFKRAPHLPFDATMTDELGANALVIRVQPDEGITLRFGSKVPGNAMEVRDVNMDFSYGAAFAEDSPEAYERLILDVLLGEPSLFPVNDGGRIGLADTRSRSRPLGGSRQARSI